MDGAFGTILLAWWLLAAATGPKHFHFVNGLAASWLGLIVLFGYSWALIHHALGGLRHFIWDTGHGLGKPARGIFVVRMATQDHGEMGQRLLDLSDETGIGCLIRMRHLHCVRAHTRRHSGDLGR